MTYHVHKQGSILGLDERLDAIVQWVTDTFVPAGYGGINLSTENLSFPDLGAGWVTLTADQESVSEPRGITTDIPNSAVAFDVKGVWQISTGFTLEHDSSNSGRTINARFWDEIDGDARTQTPIGIGRNVEVTTWSTTGFFTVAEEDVGHPFSLEIGGGDSVTVDSLSGYYFNANYVSEFQGTAPTI